MSQPSISLNWVRFDGGTFGAEMLVSGLESQSHAEAAIAHMQRLFCGTEIQLGDAPKAPDADQDRSDMEPTQDQADAMNLHLAQERGELCKACRVHAEGCRLYCTAGPECVALEHRDDTVSSASRSRAMELAAEIKTASVRDGILRQTKLVPEALEALRAFLEPRLAAPPASTGVVRGADRYRWVVENHEEYLHLYHNTSAENLDAAVDAAMRPDEPGEEVKP